MQRRQSNFIHKLIRAKRYAPLQHTEAEKAALLQEGRDLVRRARARNNDVPAWVIKREVQEAIRAVRRGQR